LFILYEGRQKVFLLLFPAFPKPFQFAQPVALGFEILFWGPLRREAALLQPLQSVL